MKRKAELERKSNETEIKAELNIDGTGKAKIQTQIGLLDHMLELFVFHGFFDLNLNVKKADLGIESPTPFPGQTLLKQVGLVHILPGPTSR